MSLVFQEPKLAMNLPPGCAFAPRCAIVTDAWRTSVAEPVDLGGGHRVRCFKTDETVKKIAALAPAVTS